MSSYLATIEDEYSRGRGRMSMLSPVDWDVAEKWEKRGIPLSIVIRAITDSFKNYKAQNRTGSINTLRYFTPEVEKLFAEWSTNQVGKSQEIENISATEENFMPSTSTAESFIGSNENLEILETIISKLKLPGLPEPLASAVAQTRGELVCLSDQTLTAQLSTDDIENRLIQLSAALEIPLVASVTDDERARIIKRAQAEYPQYQYKNQVLQKILIRKLYEKFHLPEITLFAF